MVNKWWSIYIYIYINYSWNSLQYLWDAGSGVMSPSHSSSLLVGVFTVLQGQELEESQVPYFQGNLLLALGVKLLFKKIGHLDLAFQGSNRIMLYHSYWNTQYQCWSMPRFVFNFLRSPTWHYHRWILWTTRHIDRDLFCASILVNIQTWNLPKVYTSFPSNSRKDRAFGT